MSDCYTAEDVNFTNSGSNSRITGLYRPALARVWHGMLLLIGTQGQPDKPAAVKARMYDPYAGGFTPMFPLSVAGPLCVAGPALFYADLFTWIFYSDGTNFVCASAPQPAPNSNDNQLPFDDFQFGPASVVAANTTAINPTVILFNGQVYVFWTDAPPQGTYNTIYVTSAPYQPSNDGTTAPTLTFGPVSQLQTFVGASPTSEPSLAVYNGSLYCAYRDQSGFIQVLTLGPDLVPQTVNTATGDCGDLQCTYAPAIAADPKGTFLVIVFCKPGSSTQLCTSYLPLGATVWTAPQLINKQLTNLSPTLVTTGGNLGYIGYSCTDGTGTNLTVSGYLPNTLKD